MNSKSDDYSLTGFTHAHTRAYNLDQRFDFYGLYVTLPFNFIFFVDVLYGGILLVHVRTLFVHGLVLSFSVSFVLNLGI